jgi:hypothetical protein
LSFTNQGVLEASNGGELLANRLLGNVGNASVTGTGSWLRLHGDYTVNQTLSATDNSTLSLQATWSNLATIQSVDSTVNLEGNFTLPSATPFDRTGGTINLKGTLDNTGSTLVLDSSTGSWNVDGGRINGGTVTESGGAQLIFNTNYLNNRLDGVTINGDLDLTLSGAAVLVLNGLTLNGTAHLGSNAALGFSGDQTFAAGTVVFEGAGSAAISVWNGTT